MTFINLMRLFSIIFQTDCRDMQIDKELKYVVDEIDFSQFFAISKPYDEEK
ncbi:TPA: hypothetical protein N2777_000585 [Vibrio parahaemolyticus]|nr:hypothetical protein [Vibrio parahaemolyticus]